MPGFGPWRAVSVVALMTLAGCGATNEASKSNIGAGLSASDRAMVQGAFASSVPDTVYFPFNAATLTMEAKASLDLQAEWILAHPQARFSVTGHTDLVGNVDYNMALGLARAEAIVAYLVDSGIGEERLQALVSMGEDLPLIDTQDREAMNRRGTTEVLEALLSPEDASGIPQGISTVPAEEVTAEPEVETATTVEAAQAPESNSQSDYNSGRGNGDELGDPGNSQSKNKGGDELG